MYAFTCVYQNDMQLCRNANAGVKLVSMHINKYFVYILYTVLIEICGDGGGGGGSKNKYIWSFNYG